MNMSSEQPKDHPAQARGKDPNRRWTVLFIGDHGRVIGFKRIKTLIALTIAALAISLAAVAVLVIVNHQLHGRTRDLQERLEASHRKIQALHEERDLLTAHVVLVETRMKEILAGSSRPAPERRSAPAEEAKKFPKDSVDGPGASEQGAIQPPPAKDFKSPIDMGESVSLEGFRIKFDPDRHAFELQYKVVNASQGRKPLNGHVILVFKSDHLEPDQWLAMPRVDLPRGRPSGSQKGYTFSISHSKTFTQSMAAPASFPTFTKAVLYVFSKEGQLMFANDYEVDIPASSK
jgi:hypothetical protein